MDSDLNAIMNNIKLSHDLINKIANEEANKAIEKLINESKLGVRTTHYPICEPRVSHLVINDVTSETRRLLESKGFYTTSCSGSMCRYVILSVDKISKWKKFLYKINWI